MSCGGDFKKVLPENVKFAHPGASIVVGPSGCGKTRFLMSVIKHRAKLFHPPPKAVVVCYSHWQEAYDQYILSENDTSVTFQRGGEFTTDPSCPTLVILDDLPIAEYGRQLAEIFTIRCHHENLSAMYVSHALFHNDPYYRLACQNAHYYIIFRSIRAVSSVNTLARQLFINDKRKMRNVITAFHEATRKPYSYLVIDVDHRHDDTVRLRSNIIPMDTVKAIDEKSLIKTYML